MAGEPDLAADRGRALEDDHVVARTRRLGGGGETGGPGADDDDARGVPRPAAGAAASRSRPVRGFCAQRIGVSAW